MTNGQPIIEIDVEIPFVSFEVDAATADVTVVPPGFDVTLPSSPPTVVLYPTPGPPGPRGLPGTGVPITGEAPAGAIDGSNVTFASAQEFQPDTTQLFLNGLLEINYTEVPPTHLLLDDPPLPGDVLRLNYVVA